MTAVVPTAPATPLVRPGIDALTGAYSDGGGVGGGSGGSGSSGGDSSGSDGADEGPTLADRLAGLSAAGAGDPTTGAAPAGTAPSAATGEAPRPGGRRRRGRKGAQEEAAASATAAVTTAATAQGDGAPPASAAVAAVDGDAAARGAVGTLAGALEQALRTSDAAMLEKALNATARRGAATPAATVAALPPGVATATLLPALVARLTRRPARTDTLLPWVSAILVGHAATLLAAGPDSVPGRALAALAAAFGGRARGRAALVGLGGRLDLLAARAAAAEGATVAPSRVVVGGRLRDVPLVRFDVEEVVEGGVQREDADDGGWESGDEEGDGAMDSAAAVRLVADAADGDDIGAAGASSSDAEDGDASGAESSEGDGSGGSRTDGSAESDDVEAVPTADAERPSQAGDVTRGVVVGGTAEAAGGGVGGRDPTSDAAMDVSV